MTIIRSIKKMQALSRRLAAEGKTIGLVPTMGFLHEGHLSLIKRALKKSDVVITTIFVNPTQFGPKEDLDKYPRDEKGDIGKIKKAGGEIIFIPKMSDVYPDNYETYVTVEKLTKSLEGKKRPEHFRGVTTIVAKLLNITRPDVVIFGLKDYQQAIVLKKMTTDLNYPVKYIIAPTVREKDGLAMSSRNKYFDARQRKEAVCLYQALLKAKKLIKAGRKSTALIEKEMRTVIKTICPKAKISYIAFTDFSTLNPITSINKKDVIVSLAVKVHGVNLIDNMKLS